METKCLEIRDKCTCIPALAIRMRGDTEIARYYVHTRSGYPRDGSSIMLMVLYTGKATNEPYEWESLGLGPRTMPVAHKFIIEHFGELSDGDVVDVEFILGESSAPKRSERII